METWTFVAACPRESLDHISQHFVWFSTLQNNSCKLQQCGSWANPQVAVLMTPGVFTVCYHSP